MSTAYSAASVIIPAQGGGGKADTLYGWRPDVNQLQDFTVQRNTAASRVNEAGLIEFVGVNEPRFDWGEGGSCPSLLVEPERMNLVLRSEEFDNAAWAKFETTVTANNTIAPDGTTTADKIIESATTDAHIIRNPQTLASGLTYSISCFLKADTRNVAWLIFGGNTFGFPSLDFRRGIFDLSNGTIIASPTNGSAKIVNYGNGWYRCSVTITIDTGGTGNLVIILADPLDPFDYIYTGDGVSGFFAWGAQLEEGSYPTSYIKTEANQVTRNADAISKTGISSLIGQSEGTLYVDAAVSFIQTQYITLSDNSNSNRVQITFGSGGQVVMGIIVGGSVIVSESSGGSTLTANTFLKIAIRYSVNNFSLFVNGTELASSSSGITFPAATLDTLKLALGNGGSPFEGNVRTLAWYKTALTNDELAALTTL